MRYKVEVIVNGHIVREYYYPNLTHPKQAARRTVEKIQDKIDYFIMIIANEQGEVWSMVARADQDEGMVIRKHRKYGNIMGIDDIDMVFTGNKKLYGRVVQ